MKRPGPESPGAKRPACKTSWAKRRGPKRPECPGTKSQCPKGPGAKRPGCETSRSKKSGGETSWTKMSGRNVQVQISGA